MRLACESGGSGPWRAGEWEPVSAAADQPVVTVAMNLGMSSREGAESQRRAKRPGKQQALLTLNLNTVSCLIACTAV